MMVEVNVAADVLQGKQRPSGGSHHEEEPEPSYSSPPRPKREPEVITWDQAEAHAGVPSGVTWKFKTQNAYGGHGDTSVTGFVVVGHTEADHWVFVAVEHYRSQNAFTGENVDEWWMDSTTAKGALRDVAPRMIRQMFQFPHLSKSFNSKVEILPEGMVFSQKMSLMLSGRAVSFKDAMDLLGALSDDDPWKGRKLQVLMVLASQPEGDGGDYQDTIELVVNGRGFKLDPRSVEYIKTKTKVLRSVFGTYFYFSPGSGSKKFLTKAKEGKRVLEFLAEHLDHEPQPLRDALRAASAQM
jgi:hypothetical protein